MTERKIDLATPPIWHNEQDGVYGKSKIDSVKKRLMDCFLARMQNAIEEKITYCTEVEKLTLDDARSVLTHVIKKLPYYLLPFSSRFNAKKNEPQEDIDVLRIHEPLSEHKLPNWPSKDDEIPENAFSL